MKISFLISIFIVIASIRNNAQKIITVEDAIKIALQNNYGILIAGNDTEIAQVNNSAGNAGMLPNITASGSNNYSVNNIKQEYADGSQSNITGVHSNAISAAILLNWTVFDGGKMFITKSKLNQMQNLGYLNFKETVLKYTYNIIVAYFNIVKQKQQLASIQEAILFNEERVKIYQTSFNSGLSPKTNLLQAKIDLNVNRENIISQQFIIDAAKRELNQLLGRNADSTGFEVIDSIPLNYNPEIETIKQKINSKNNSLLITQKQIEINNLYIKELNAGRLPKINLNAGYDFLKTDNSKGTLSMNRTYGPQIGATLSIPLFQGGYINRQVSIAKIDLNSSLLALEGLKIEINTQLINSLNDFENQKALLSIEQENYELAKENMDIAMQRLRYGQTTSLEVRQAQESFQNSATRLINFKYNLKIAETKLKQLIAEL